MQNLLRMGIAAIFIISSAVNAEGGISLGATRVIYPAEAKQTSLAVNNSDKKSRFLINSWLALSDDKMAHQVAIQLRDHDLSPLDLEAPSQAISVDYNGNSLLQFFANYIALVNNPTPGIAKSDATFTINYY